MAKQCGPCGGSGKCDMCEGTGTTDFGSTDGKLKTCGHCKGTRKCRYCGGTGDADSQLAKDLWYGRKDISQC
jgi:hypothetical protein